MASLRFTILSLAIIISMGSIMVDRGRQIRALETQVTALKTDRDAVEKMASGFKDLITVRNIEINNLRHSQCLEVK